MREIPVKDNYYDSIICLSTLEHIGCDNTIYTQNHEYKEQKCDDFMVAMKELGRVLKPEGSLFLSVPFGKYGYFQGFQQFDYPLLQKAITAFGATKSITETFYKYTPQGWLLSTAQDCENCEYVAWLISGFEGGELPHPLPVEFDRAAAARGVACIHLIKS